jgi:hypothetical protein
MLDYLSGRLSSLADFFPNQNSFNRHPSDFIDKCIVENKAPDTLLICKMWGARYLQYIYPETPTRSNPIVFFGLVERETFYNGQNKRQSLVTILFPVQRAQSFSEQNAEIKIYFSGLFCLLTIFTIFIGLIDKTI